MNRMKIRDLILKTVKKWVEAAEGYDAVNRTICPVDGDCGGMTEKPKAASRKTYDVRKASAAKKKILEYSKDFNGTLDDNECMMITGVAKSTYLKYKRELEALKKGKTV